MKLPRFGRFFSGAGDDDEWRDYDMKEENWWEKEESTKREAREADIARGHWVVSDQLTQEEEEAWQDIKHNIKYYNAEEKTENGQIWTVHVFKDADIEAKFDALEKKETRPRWH